jgi:hypothetical protein
MLFSDKVVSIAHHIEGIMENKVSDLHTIIYQCYEGSSTPTFATAVSTLLAKCFQNDKEVHKWEENVTMLKSMYCDLKMRASWVALKHTGEKVEAQGLSAEANIRAMKAEVKRLTKLVASGNTATSTRTANSNSNSNGIVCYHCGEKGHKTPNCPNKYQPKKYTGPDYHTEDILGPTIVEVPLGARQS